MKAKSFSQKGVAVLLGALFLFMGCSKLSCAKPKSDVDEEARDAAAAAMSAPTGEASGLTVTVGAKTYDFKDNPSDSEQSVSHRLVAQWQNPPAAIVERSFYEGGNYLLLLENGSIELKGYPVQAPGGNDFVIVSVDQSGNSWNGIQVWGKTAAGFAKSFEYQPKEMEYFNFLNWINPSKIQLEYTTYISASAPDKGLMCVPAVLERQGLNWKLTKLVAKSDKTQDCGIKSSEPEEEIPEEE